MFLTFYMNLWKLRFLQKNRFICCLKHTRCDFMSTTSRFNVILRVSEVTRFKVNDISPNIYCIPFKTWKCGKSHKVALTNTLLKSLCEYWIIHNVNKMDTYSTQFNQIPKHHTLIRIISIFFTKNTFYVLSMQFILFKKCMLHL